jgi:hypothetical protein
MKRRIEPAAAPPPEATIPAADPTPGRAVEFRATIPVKAAAIDIHGETGARLTLEIADSDMGDFLPIVLLRGKRLRVTVAEDPT